MSYTKTVWEDLPSTDTPLNATNLNKIEDGIEGVDERIDGIDQEVEGISQSLGVDTNTYDNTATYSVGDKVIYENKIYECNTDISTAEDFDSSKWDLVPVIDNMNINNKLMKTKTIWSGNVYAINQQTNIGQDLESGHLYAFEVKGLSSLYYEYIPFVSNGGNQAIQHTTYDGTTAVRWRIGLTSNTFNLDSNSLNIGANTAITKIIEII